MPAARSSSTTAPGVLCAREAVRCCPPASSPSKAASRADDAVELAGPDRKVFAKGLVRVGSDVLASIAGRRTADLPDGVVHEVVHRDDLVVLP